MSKNYRENLDSIAIGRFAGENSATENTISIGRKAGYLNQQQYAIALGDRAGEETQGLNAIAIGDQAGRTTQGTQAIAIGKMAGNANQGAGAIAIGNSAGSKGQPDYSIIISTSDTAIAANKKGLYIDPIRNFDDRDSIPLNGNILTYLQETKEVVTGLPKLPGYTSDPAAVDAGTLYFNTDKKKVKVYDGTKWTALSDEDDLNKLKAELMTAIKTATKTSSAAALAGVGAALAGGNGTVVGSNYGSAQATTGATFVTGGGATTVTPQYVVDPATGETRIAVAGKDFYWQDVRGADGADAYAPVFYNNITVTGTIAEYTNNNPNLGGYYITEYSNGHKEYVPIPVADYSPSLDQYNNLELQQRRELLTEYGTKAGVGFMVSPSMAADPYNDPNAYESKQFQDFLKSKGF